MTTKTVGLGVFVGIGLLTAHLEGTGGFSVGGTGESTVLVSNFSASGTVIVTYTYTESGGACCFDDGSCSDSTQPDCITGGGIWTGLGTNCATVSCPGAGSQTQTLSYSYPLAPGSAILGFDQFDDHGGTRMLIEVQIELDGQMQADVTAENDSDLPAPDLSLGITGVFALDFEALGASEGLSEQFPTDGVGPSDGIPGSGRDFWDFGTVVLPTAAFDSTTTDLEPYIGAGRINATVFSTGGYSLSGASDTTLLVDNYFAAGDVTVTYLFIEAAGACCFLDQSCGEIAESDCAAAGGTWQGGTRCAATVCAETGACCFTDGGCEVASEDTCADQGGLWQGADVRCGPPEQCLPCLIADITGDGTVGFTDLLIVLSLWGPCPPDCFGDLDGDGVVGFVDLLTVISAWGPCP